MISFYGLFFVIPAFGIWWSPRPRACLASARPLDHTLPATVCHILKNTAPESSHSLGILSLVIA